MNLDSENDNSDRDGLGSLAQQSRGKQLKTARGILFFVGILTVLANGYFYVAAEDEVRKQVDKELAEFGGRRNIAPQKQKELKDLEEQAVRTTKIAALIFSGVGIAFIIFGIGIYSYPVPITITALILFIAGGAVTAVIEPESIARGLIVKIIIVVALAKSIQAAIAYEAERKKEALARRRLDDFEEEPA